MRIMLSAKTLACKFNLSSTIRFSHNLHNVTFRRQLCATQIRSLRLGDVLGVGSFSIVREACLPQDSLSAEEASKAYAVKIMFAQNESRRRLQERKVAQRAAQLANCGPSHKKYDAARQSFFVEMAALKQIGPHPHIIQCLGHSDDGKQLSMVLEKCESDIVTKKKPDLGKLRRQCFQMISAIAHIHAAGVIHRDIRPDNLLVRGEDVVLADFGLAAFAKDGDAEGLVGYRPCVAPEIFDTGLASAASDVYSAGITMAWMLLRRYPDNLSDIAENCPPAAAELIMNMISKNPAGRLSASQVLAHPWFQPERAAAL